MIDINLFRTLRKLDIVGDDRTRLVSVRSKVSTQSMVPQVTQLLIPLLLIRIVGLDSFKTIFLRVSWSIRGSLDGIWVGSSSSVTQECWSNSQRLRGLKVAS